MRTDLPDLPNELFLEIKRTLVCRCAWMGGASCAVTWTHIKPKSVFLSHKRAALATFILLIRFSHQELRSERFPAEPWLVHGSTSGWNQVWIIVRLSLQPSGEPDPRQPGVACVCVGSPAGCSTSTTTLRSSPPSALHKVGQHRSSKTPSP